MSTKIAIANWIVASPSTLAAIYQLVDRKPKRTAQGLTTARTRSPLFVTILLFVGSFGLIAFGFWVIYHPLLPTVIEKTVFVEKQVQCPPVKSGAATTRGAQSPATTGSGNAVTYGQPVQPQIQQKH
jgi:hypothetical protein